MAIEVAGRRYAQQKIFKNDFFAITALYADECAKVLLKVNRQAGFLLLPLSWVGRVLANRECAALERLRGVEGIPHLIGRWGSTGLVREFIDGTPLVRGARVPDDFHMRLRRLVEQIHDRGMAYVDLEKCENVLVGTDGRPHLFDFQISWYVSPRWGGELWPLRTLRRWFQKGDLYHLRKLQRRTRPDQLSPGEWAASYRKPWYVHVHRRITWPFTWCRRRILDRLDPRRRNGERGRVSHDDVIGVT